MEAKPREIKIYQTPEGKAPFETWFYGLKDKVVRRKIRVRLDRTEEGNLGEWNAVGRGISEMKINYGPGYRIYFGQEGNTLVILLCGGDKRTQKNDIKKAQAYWEDYCRRVIP
ncbi:MAG: type II toxin-antitoxin system RelE/ParE family toxin [Deltaproteobacteria bacterium]|nr:type II toxin-antitoxin system RelE/ParE family toxin [Deltaproteobacteria bacterium]